MRRSLFWHFSGNFFNFWLSGLTFKLKTVNLLNIMVPKLVTFYETAFWFEGAYPSTDKVLKHFDMSLIDLKAILPNINSALSKRGLTPVTLTPSKSSGLDPNFVLACDLMVDTIDKRSTKIKLEAAGIDSKRWKALLRDAKHREYFLKRVNLTMADVESAASLGLAKLVESTDLNAIKYFNELTGVYRPNQETLINLGVLIGKLMEILVKYVEPAVLADIATEIETVVLEKPKALANPLIN